MFKVVYADKLKELVPDFAVLQKLIDFSPADKETGNYYAQPVALSHEAGFTYNGEAGTVVSLSASVAGVMKEAQVKGSELILSSKLAYTALSRASTQGTKAFKRVSSWKVEDMNSAMRRRLEIAMLYGQQGIGTVLTNTVGALVITEATWAGGIWAGAEGSILEAFTGITATETQHDGSLTVSAVDQDTRTITVTGTSTSVAPGDVLYFKGARTASAYNEMAGLRKIITNTGSLFNVDASTYSLWKGTTASSTGALSFGGIQDAVAKAVNKGLLTKCAVLVSPKGWAVLNSDQAALRVFDSSFSSKKFENGAEAIVFHGPNGALEVRSHPFVKDGDAFIVPLESVIRIGSVDLSFGVPGMDEQFFTLVSGTNAVELQCMADQAIFVEAPGHAVFMTGITY